MPDAGTNTPISDIGRKFGCCEGKNSEYLKLVSADGYEFVIKRKYAFCSVTIRDMMDGPGSEGIGEEDTNLIEFHEVPSYILERICSYLMYKFLYSGADKAPPEFPIGPKISVELMLAAEFFRC